MHIPRNFEVSSWISAVKEISTIYRDPIGLEWQILTNWWKQVVHKAPNFVGVWERMLNNFTLSIMVKKKKKVFIWSGQKRKKKSNNVSPLHNLIIAYKLETVVS